MAVVRRMNRVQMIASSDLDGGVQVIRKLNDKRKARQKTRLVMPATAKRRQQMSNGIRFDFEKPTAAWDNFESLDIRGCNWGAAGGKQEFSSNVTVPDERQGQKNHLHRDQHSQTEWRLRSGEASAPAAGERCMPKRAQYREAGIWLDRHHRHGDETHPSRDPKGMGFVRALTEEADKGQAEPATQRKLSDAQESVPEAKRPGAQSPARNRPGIPKKCSSSATFPEGATGCRKRTASVLSKEGNCSRNGRRSQPGRGRKQGRAGRPRARAIRRNQAREQRAGERMGEHAARRAPAFGWYHANKCDTSRTLATDRYSCITVQSVNDQPAIHQNPV
ncbi:hypothetical protein FB45DRAFT_1126500 [Roridomyces roridus]|uniref:Uncharacterized protein n=1 Tax=Roridomyces roridus TaxID=1738132 RepID=A0AAD7CB33_9AGAR|nr:hypothetical protein FB45DRAFT_1126500 [Roridomyces roridus]